MKRYTRAYRTRKNVTDTSALRDQFIRDLTKEANAVILQLTQQFSETLQAQTAQAVTNIVAGDAAPRATGDASIAPGDTGTVGSITKLISTGVRYLINRPRTSTNTVETSRSADASAFRLSRSQAAAEAQIVMSMGDKNS